MARLPAPDQLRLDDWANLKAELDWIYEGKVDPPYRVISRRFLGQSVFLIRQGTVLIRTAKGSRRAGPGQWILPGEDRRLQQFSDDARILSVHLNLEWPGGQPLFAWDIACVFAAKAAPRLEAEALKLLRLVRRRFPRSREMLPQEPCSLPDYVAIRHAFTGWLRALVDALLAQGFSPSRHGKIDARVLGAVQAIDRLPVGDPFQERLLASRVNLSANRLDRLFVKQFGITPRRYFEQRKLNKAVSLIRSSKPIKETAFELGFASLPHFSSWFRLKTGLSPRRFRSETTETLFQWEGLRRDLPAKAVRKRPRP